jgi:asparagine synthase (glutamine-hydrolysing)
MYFCALRPSGHPIHKSDLFSHISRLRQDVGGSFRSVMMGPFAAIVREDAERPSRLSHTRSMVAAGDVRLDNRAEIAALADEPPAAGATDLDLVLAAIDAVGESCIPRLLGDFAFVLWDARAQKLLAVRDAFGVKPLYHRVTAELALFASRTSPLHPADELDPEYITDFILGMNTGTTRTVWAQVQTVPAGSILRFRGTAVSSARYWSALDFTPGAHSNEADDATRFRQLLQDSVRQRAANEQGVWAHLSGGLDSSSIVCIAAALADEGVSLDGTLTMVDTLGDGDERAFSNLIVDRFDLRNEHVTDYWAWQETERAPVTDEPYPMYPFFARDLRMRDVVREAGGRILLSGTGSDHYLGGSLDYIGDLASHGHVRSALKEVLAWSIRERQSFWRLTHRELIRPMLPFTRMVAGTPPLPRWLRPTFVRRCECLHTRRASGGSRFARHAAAAIATLPGILERWPYDNTVDLRYPFLSRPLVEFALQLPARERIRPEGRKWILREAMRGALPEPVRQRSTKGGIDARILWSLTHERARIDKLLREPILADIGCVDPIALRNAVDAASRGVRINAVTLFSALSLETWLSARAGRQGFSGRTAQNAA